MPTETSRKQIGVDHSGVFPFVENASAGDPMKLAQFPAEDLLKPPSQNDYTRS
jgi:hypothetical protein